MDKKILGQDSTGQRTASQGNLTEGRGPGTSQAKGFTGITGEEYVILGSRRRRASLLQRDKETLPETKEIAYGRKWRLTLLFVITAELGMAAAIILVSGIIGGNLNAKLLGIANEQAARDALHIQTVISGGYSMPNRSSAGDFDSGPGVPENTQPVAHVMSSARFAAEGSPLLGMQQSMPSNPMLLTSSEGLPSAYTTLADTLNIVNLSLFDLDGRAVWSSDPGVLSVSEQDMPKYLKATAGAISSELAQDRQIVDSEGVSRRVDVVETYLPLRETPSGQVIGVMKIDRDAASDVALQLDGIMSTLLGTTVATMGGLFLLLVGFIVMADLHIYRSSRRAYATLERESLAKTQILSTVTHELKTPLTSIMGCVERLLLHREKVGPLNDRQQKYLSYIQEDSRILRTLIDDLLDISRIEAGNFELKLTELNVQTEIERDIRTVQNQFAEEPIDVVVNIPSGLCPVRADGLRFSQIVTNLVCNAYKYSPAGSTITITVSQTSGFIQIDVADQGMGLSPADQPKVFTKFFRADNSSTRKQSGTGLGLYITKLLVEAHGGRIWFESEKGMGSTFSFALPAAKSGVTC